MTIRSGVVGRTGRLRLKGLELAKLRMFCLVRAKYRCEECGCWVSWETSEMAHRQSRGAGGSDTPDNVRCLCRECHRAEHQPKAVAKKYNTEEHHE